MHINSDKETTRRRPVNLTIREDILNDAKILNLNASKAAEHGIVMAIKEARGELWLKENKKALSVHNKRIEERGTLLTPDWADK